MPVLGIDFRQNSRGKTNLGQTDLLAPDATILNST